MHICPHLLSKILAHILFRGDSVNLAGPPVLRGPITASYTSSMERTLLTFLNTENAQTYPSTSSFNLLLFFDPILCLFAIKTEKFLKKKMLHMCSRRSAMPPFLLII